VERDAADAVASAPDVEGLVDVAWLDRAAGAGSCDTRSHVVSELVEEVWLMPET
jgi:hypothetical protein